MKKYMNIPRLLAPAGSYDALCAALSAGADEVYFGAGSFHARQGAKNFTDEEFCEALKLCRLCGVKSNITVNTLLFDRELKEALDSMEKAASMGADCFIVQDMGLAAAVRQEMPSLELHASTQCACHNREGAQALYEAGFSRIVLARELSAQNIREISLDAPYETELFLHGALCVCHSGQCLFSSAVGGRSGNRGMCAQPCRMAYELSSDGRRRKGFPLSLKDLSLAEHIDEILTLGCTALKIEGRMKSPEYVYGVTKLFKTLLSQQRNATHEEMQELHDLFSRDGFTDGYFTGRVLVQNSSMYGIRRETEKELTRKTQAAMTVPLPKCRVKASFYCRTGELPCLTLQREDRAVTVTGDTPVSPAQKMPATRESILRQLVKMGNTPFLLPEENVTVTLADDCFVPAGVVNELRRRACESLLEVLTKPVAIHREPAVFTYRRGGEMHKQPALRLYVAGTEHFEEKAEEYTGVESVLFPLSAFLASEPQSRRIREIAAHYRVGVLMPRVITGEETETAVGNLQKAASCGACFCEVSNIGHIALARRAGLEVYGGVGLNVTNSLTARYYHSLGITSLVLSPELKLAAVRDLQKEQGMSYCFYVRGRLPLMTLESCLVRAHQGCTHRPDGSVCGILTDRMHLSFPVMAQKRQNREYPCRNIVYNSVITDLRGKKELYTAGLDVFCLSAEEDGMPL